MLVPNCPGAKLLGAKLSWCQIVLPPWEDLALNAGTLPNIVIDPYFLQIPSNVPITGLEEKEA